jgi:hypothetical protein
LDFSPHGYLSRDSKFYSRNSAGKYALDVDELRNAFAFARVSGDKIRDFRADRISKIGAGLAPIALLARSLVVLHIIPVSALESETRLDVGQVCRTFHPNEIHPIFSNRGFTTRINFDGYLAYDWSEEHKAAMSYLQVFRNGVVESVSVEVLYGDKIIEALPFEGKLLRESVPSYLRCLKNLGVAAPAVVAVTLVGASGYRMTVPDLAILAGLSSGTAIDRDVLMLPEAMLESSDSDLDSALKPVFDSLWNASGKPASPYFAGGKFVGSAAFAPKFR